MLPERSRVMIPASEKLRRAPGKAMTSGVPHAFTSVIALHTRIALRFNHLSVRYQRWSGHTMSRSGRRSGCEGPRQSEGVFMMKRLWVFAAACVVSLGAPAACYTVFAKSGKVIYQSERAPVSLAYPLHETVPVRLGPGATLAFTSDFGSCTPVGEGEERTKRGNEDVLSVLTNLRPYGGTETSSTGARYGSSGSGARPN